MQQKITRFPEEIYSANLQTINHIKFSLREVDILASLLSEEETKEIAAFLSIAPRTVDNSLYNIAKRINVNSRKEIIEFIKQAPEFPYIQEYYNSLSLQVFFEKQLIKISKLIEAPFLTCTVVYWQDNVIDKSLICLFKKHLERVGIKVSIKTNDKDQNINERIKLTKNEQDSYTIFIISDSELEKLYLEEENLFTANHNQLSQKNIFLLLRLRKFLNTSSKPQNCILLESLNSQHFYFCVLEILNKLLPHINFTSIKSELEQQTLHSCVFLEDKLFSLKFNAIYKLKSILGFFQFKRLKWILITLLSVSAFSIPWYMIKEFRDKKTFISSDLSFPATEGFLERPKLNMILKNKFKDPKEIQTVALVGIGGSGKTTLARYHARQENASIIWEINAETKNSLMNSFEALAYALDEEKKILNILREIKNTQEREERLFLFIKRKLKSYQNWFLIYDNVEEFRDIQNYFPSDPNVWGAGKIIITSRNGNIENNEHVNHTIYMGELEPEEKLDLFLKINRNTNYYRLDSDEIKKVTSFLTEIPSFPLDVSIAAYYIKATNISCSDYIENLKQHHQGFASLQKDILKDTGEYRKTRYEIIGLSLKKLIETDKDFLDLLLLITLLDSQNIPRDLVDSYKSKFTTDKLIYNLKKYSLIFNTEGKAKFFSLHRNTQEIMLKYFEENYISYNMNLLQRAANNLKQYLVKILDKEEFSKINLLSSHCEIFLTHSRFLTNEIKGSIGSELGFIYFCLGDLSKSRKLLEESIMYLKKDLTSNNKLLARSLGHLGITYRDFGDFKKAKDLLEQSLKIYTFIKDKLGVAWVLSYLGLIHKNLGNYRDATSYLEQSLIIYKKNKFTNNVGLGRALGHLGIVNLEIGNYLKARALFQESLQTHKSNIIKNSLNIAWDLAHIGIVDTILGDYNKAKQSLEQSLTIYEKNFPKNSIRYTWVMAHLGEVYTFLGDYKKALNLFEISIATYNKNFPIESSKTHVSIAWILSMLGSAYIKMKNYKEAKLLFQKIIISYKQHYGENHTTYASILRKMGQIYFLNGEMESAEKSIKRTLELFQKVNHPESYMDLELLADIYLKKAENESIKLKNDKLKIFTDQATKYLKQALEILHAHFPNDSCHIIRIQKKLKNG